MSYKSSGPYTAGATLLKASGLMLVYVCSNLVGLLDKQAVPVTPDKSLVAVRSLSLRPHTLVASDLIR